MSEADTMSLDESIPSRYVVGIDLGTTNCAVAFVDGESSSKEIQTFKIDQHTDLGTSETRETLPSFAYQPTKNEVEGHKLRLNWQSKRPNWLTGVIARDHGSRMPDRQIMSAKSWLCHNGVDRTAKLLPWQASDDIDRLSPIQASSLYLTHIREAWDAKFSDYPLADQDVILTIPASFDEMAREFTVEAAKNAGLSRIVLIEEPQAAFYTWLHRHRESWQSIVQEGTVILVCDIGGGTTDFTLIQAKPTSQGSDTIRFHRLAVGDHLILGGDNLDLALAVYIEEELGKKVDRHEWDRLVRQCRVIKEQVLGLDAPESVTVHIAGRGSRLIGGGKQASLSTALLKDQLLSGFFPDVPLDQQPEKHQSGFTEFGLPYAQDASITTHLAQFLSQHIQPQSSGELEVPVDADQRRLPDVVLFNGGMFESEIAQQRIIDRLVDWFKSERGDDWKPVVLDHDRLDLAVARGAASFGMVRRGDGVRISAGLARTYYVGVDVNGDSKAVCLLPAGTEPGQEMTLESPSFHLKVGTPMELPVFASSVRLNDQAGELVELDDEQCKRLPSIRTVIENKEESNNEIPVSLLARLTEIGTIELTCQQLNTDRRWRLQFDARSAVQTDVGGTEIDATTSGHMEESDWAACRAILQDAFVDKKSDPDRCVRQLAEQLNGPRESWRPIILRRMWEELIVLEGKRSLSARHEARWLNLVGFLLRPGYGVALDDWRVTTTWKIVQGKLLHATGRNRAESWILWRRVAGGLSTGQQESLALPMLTAIRQAHRQATTGRGKGATIEFGSHEASEIWRLLGALERLPIRFKIELGSMILDLCNKRRFQQSRDGMLWALGRIGTRIPMYGLLNNVVAPDIVEEWLRRLRSSDSGNYSERLAAMQLARICGDRYRDVNQEVRTEVGDWLATHEDSQSLVTIVREGGMLSHEQRAQVTGDALPVGLSIREF